MHQFRSQILQGPQDERVAQHITARQSQLRIHDRPLKPTAALRYTGEIPISVKRPRIASTAAFRWDSGSMLLPSPTKTSVDIVLRRALYSDANVLSPANRSGLGNGHFDPWHGELRNNNTSNRLCQSLHQPIFRGANKS